MAKEKKKPITTKVENHENIHVEDVTTEPSRVKFGPVEKLEDAAKVGFYCEARPLDDTLLEPMYRLCCESKDPDAAPTILTPWCTAASLGAMVQGCMFLNPLIIRCIKENQKNADNPDNPA